LFCIFVQHNAGMQWRLPSQLIIVSDPLVRDVVSSTVLRRHLDYDYLHRDVASKLNHQLLTSLGVQTLSTQHLLEIGKTVVAQLQPADGTSGLMQAFVGLCYNILAIITLVFSLNFIYSSQLSSVL